MNIEFSSSSKRIFFYSFYSHNTVYKTSVYSPFVFEPDNCQEYSLGTIQELKQWILNNQCITNVICNMDTFEIPMINIGTSLCTVHAATCHVKLLIGLTLVRIKFISETQCDMF